MDEMGHASPAPDALWHGLVSFDWRYTPSCDAVRAQFFAGAGMSGVPAFKASLEGKVCVYREGEAPLNFCIPVQSADNYTNQVFSTSLLDWFPKGGGASYRITAEITASPYPGQMQVSPVTATHTIVLCSNGEQSDVDGLSSSFSSCKAA
jgi:hypothetical protein